jgi:hypothetical protein
MTTCGGAKRAFGPVEYELDSETMKRTGRTRTRQFTTPKKPLAPGCMGYPEPEPFKKPKAKP